MLLIQQNQESAQWSQDAFPREKVGSGHMTIIWCDYALCIYLLPNAIWRHCT